MAAKTKKKTTTSKSDKKPAKKAVTVKKKSTKKVKETKVSSLIVTEHILVPKHELLSDKEKQKVFEKYEITLKNLPKLLASDAIIQSLGAKEGDVIKITRKSYTAGKTVFYRGVVND